MCTCFKENEEGHFELSEIDDDDESLICSNCAEAFGEVQSEGDQKKDEDFKAFDEKDIWE